MPALTSTAVNNAAEGAGEPGACRSTGSTTIAAASRGTDRARDRSGAVLCQVPPINAGFYKKVTNSEDIANPCSA